MTVSYYAIGECTVMQIDGRTVLAAPENPGLTPDTLRKHDFLLQEDGRWVHYLTDAEMQLLKNTPSGVKISFSGDYAQQRMAQQPVQQPDAANDPPAALYLCVGSLFSMLLSIALPYESNDMLYALRGVLFVAAWVLMIVARVRYPKNLFGKVLMWMYVVLVLLGMIGMIVIGFLLMKACNECLDSCQKLP